MAISGVFGTYFNEKRRTLGLTLREFCRINGFDPGNISKIERGLLPPPQSKEKLSEYASALQIKEGTDSWLEFFDLAAASTGRIPSDIASDEEVLNALPVFFRSIRGKNMESEDIKKLIQSIRRELR